MCDALQRSSSNCIPSSKPSDSHDYIEIGVINHCFTRKVKCFTRKVKCFTRKVKCFTRKANCFTRKTKRFTRKANRFTCKTKILLYFNTLFYA